MLLAVMITDTIDDEPVVRHRTASGHYEIPIRVLASLDEEEYGAFFEQATGYPSQPSDGLCGMMRGSQRRGRIPQGKGITVGIETRPDHGALGER